MRIPWFINLHKPLDGDTIHTWDKLRHAKIMNYDVYFNLSLTLLRGIISKCPFETLRVLPKPLRIQSFPLKTCCYWLCHDTMKKPAMFICAMKSATRCNEYNYVKNMRSFRCDAFSYPCFRNYVSYRNVYSLCCIFFRTPVLLFHPH